MTATLILSACNQEHASLEETVSASFQENVFHVKLAELQSVSKEHNEEAINLSPEFIILYITLDIEAEDNIQINQDFYTEFVLEEENEPIPVKPFLEQLEDAPEDMQIIDVKEETLEEGDRSTIELAYVIKQGTEDYYLTIHEESQIHFTFTDIKENPTL